MYRDTIEIINYNSNHNQSALIHSDATQSNSFFFDVDATAGFGSIFNTLTSRWEHAVCHKGMDMKKRSPQNGPVKTASMSMIRTISSEPRLTSFCNIDWKHMRHQMFEQQRRRRWTWAKIGIHHKISSF